MSQRNFSFENCEHEYLVQKVNKLFDQVHYLIHIVVIRSNQVHFIQCYLLTFFGEGIHKKKTKFVAFVNRKTVYKCHFLMVFFFDKSYIVCHCRMSVDRAFLQL